MGSIRNLLQEKPAAGYGLAAGIIAIAVAVAMFTGGPEEDPHYFDTSVLWYYDLNTDKRFAVKADDDFAMVPPLEAPSGPLAEKIGPMPKGSPAGVRAWVFACGTCKDKQFVGYLETIEPNKRADALNGKARYADITWYRSGEGGEWHKGLSKEGDAIRDIPMEKCGDTPPQRCEVNDAPPEEREALLNS